MLATRAACTMSSGDARADGSKTMESSSQQIAEQPSQEDLAFGLPTGDPLRREHLHDVDPLPREMRDRLDRIMLGEGQTSVVPPVELSLTVPSDGGSDSA